MGTHDREGPTSQWLHGFRARTHPGAWGLGSQVLLSLCHSQLHPVLAPTSSCTLLSQVYAVPEPREWWGLTLVPLIQESKEPTRSNRGTPLGKVWVGRTPTLSILALTLKLGIT